MLVCYHPLHDTPPARPGCQPGSSLKFLQGSVKLTKYIATKHSVSLPIGATFCYQHKLNESRAKSADVSIEFEPQIHSSFIEDQDFEPNQPLVLDTSIAEASYIADSLMEVIDASPIKFQITQTKVDDLSDGTLKKIRKKYRRTILLKIKYLVMYY